MRPLRDLWSGLVERRLWPVALLLVAALVAVPLLLAKRGPDADGSSSASATAAAASAAAPAAPADATPAVSVTPADSVPGAPLGGKQKDPFKQQHVPPAPKQATAATATTAGQTPSSDAGSGSGTNGSGSGGAAPTPAPQQTYVYATIDIRFGPAAKSLRSIEDVPRLTPLPNADSPVTVFLGMRRDLKTAVFLVSTDVNARGQGKCEPSESDCQAVELKQNQDVFLDVRASDGTVTQYELDLVRVTLHETTSKAVAKSAYARASRAGARWLSQQAHDSARNTDAERPLRIPFRYAAGSGVLHIAPWMSQRLAHGHGAHGAVAHAQAVAGPRASIGDR